jgi:RNA polymerase sigma factor (sigma-70 family)
MDLATYMSSEPESSAPTCDPDATLTAAWLAGDNEALARLLERSLPSAYRIARCILGSDDTVADSVQEACMTATGKRHRFRTGTCFRAWFLAIVHHRAIDSARRRKRHVRRTIPLSEMPAASEPVSNASEARELISAALLHMRRDHALAVLLRHGECCDFHEIAIALGVGERTARTWVSRGMAWLDVWFRRRGSQLGLPTLAAVIASAAEGAVPEKILESMQIAIRKGTITASQTSLLARLLSIGAVAAVITLAIAFFEIDRSNVPMSGITSSELAPGSDDGASADRLAQILALPVYQVDHKGRLEVAMSRLNRRLGLARRLEWIDLRDPATRINSGLAPAPVIDQDGTVRFSNPGFIEQRADGIRVAELLDRYAATYQATWRAQGGKIVFVSTAFEVDPLEQLRARVLGALSNNEDIPIELPAAATVGVGMPLAQYLTGCRLGNLPCPAITAFIGDAEVAAAIERTLAKPESDASARLALGLALWLRIPLARDVHAHLLNRVWKDLADVGRIPDLPAPPPPIAVDALLAAVHETSDSQERWEALILAALQRNRSDIDLLRSFAAAKVRDRASILGELARAAKSDTTGGASWWAWLDEDAAGSGLLAFATSAPRSRPTENGIFQLAMGDEQHAVYSAAGALAGCRSDSAAAEFATLLTEQRPLESSARSYLLRALEQTGGAAALDDLFERLMHYGAESRSFAILAEAVDRDFLAGIPGKFVEAPTAAKRGILALALASDDPALEDAIAGMWASVANGTDCIALSKILLGSRGGSDPRGWALVEPVIKDWSDEQILQLLRANDGIELWDNAPFVAWALKIATDVSKATELRAAAIQILSSNHPQVASMLQSLARPGQEVKLRGKALLKLDDAKLAAGVIDDQNSYIRAVALRIIVHGDVDAELVERIVAHLPQEQDPELIWRSLTALWFKEGVDLMIVTPYVDHDDVVIRRVAAATVGYFRYGMSPEAAAPIIALLQVRLARESDESVRIILRQSIKEGFGMISTPEPTCTPDGRLVPTAPEQVFGNG